LKRVIENFCQGILAVRMIAFANRQDAGYRNKLSEAPNSRRRVLFSRKFLFLSSALFFCSKSFSQVPSISYTTPQVYSVNAAIAPLTPINTGGPVPGTGYDLVSTVTGQTSRVLPMEQ
jgi:hypothetical protein